MDNHRSAVDKKFALKLLNQYADSYQLLHSQHKLLEGEIKDLKINIKINKEIISNFLSKSSLSEKNTKMISKLRNQIDQLLESNEELSKQNISLLSTQNKILQEITSLKEDNETKVDKIFMLEQSLIQKENIIKSYNKKNKYSSPFVVIDPNKAITAINDELLTYKTIYNKVSKYLQRNCEKINQYEKMITKLQNENGNLKTQNKLQMYSANREKETMILKLREEFTSKSNTNNTNISDNNTCVSSYTRMGQMKLGLNNLEEKNRQKLTLKNRSVNDKEGESEYDYQCDSEDFNEVLKVVGISLDHLVIMSKNKLYSKLTDAIEYMHKMIVEKNVCINLLEVENESLNKKNFALNKENIELLADKKKNDDSMINNTSQITINNVHINNMSSVNKMITDTNKVTFTIESITSSEFNKECNMIPSFTEQDDNKCLADIVINK